MALHCESWKPDDRISRRHALKLGATAAVATGIATVVPATPARGATSSSSLEVEIPGAPAASANVHEVVLGTIVMRPRADDAAAAQGLFRSADVDWGTTRIVFAMPEGAPNDELQVWLDQVRAGRSATRDVTVVVRSPESKATYVLEDAIPVEYGGKTFDAQPGVLTEYLLVKPARVEMS